jgi:hypothetical protein
MRLMRWLLPILLIAIPMLIGISRFFVEINETQYIFYIGPASYIHIASPYIKYDVDGNQYLDYECVQNALDDKIDKDTPFYKIKEYKEVLKLIEYMKSSNSVITYGSYTIGENSDFREMVNVFQLDVPIEERITHK